MKPSIISLHYTTKCGHNCPHCYLKKQISNKQEILKEEWLKLPYELSMEDYIKKIAIAINYYPIDSLIIDQEINFIFSFLKECSIVNIPVDITTDPVIANYIISKINFYNDHLLKIIDVFSISIDDNRKFNIEILELLIEELKQYGVNSINANFLITKESKNWINDNILEKLASIFDTVHIIFQKPFTYTRDEYYSIIDQLYCHDVFENEKYIIDPCILFRLGLVDHCHNTNCIIDINPYGSISGCAYDHFDMEIGNIKHVSDILEILNNKENKKIIRCKYLEFVDSNENNKTEFRKFNSD